jgi:hypothetical protein
MTDYRVYIVGAGEGHFCDVVPLVCADDEEAIRLAQTLAIDRDVELWQLDRKVASIPAQNKATMQ